MVDFAVVPERTALVNVDMQNCFVQGSPFSAPDGLVVDPCDILLEKPRFGAFHGTDLELILRSRGIDTIIVTGIATNVCCETTAREAAVRDFRVFFLSDGTTTFGIGDVSAAQLQRATCATLGLLFGQVVTVDDVIGKILPSAFPCVAKNFEPG